MYKIVFSIIRWVIFRIFLSKFFFGFTELKVCMVLRPQNFHKMLQCSSPSKVFFSSQCLVYVHFKICYIWFEQHEKETKCTVCKQKSLDSVNHISKALLCNICDGYDIWYAMAWTCPFPGIWRPKLLKVKTPYWSP